MFKLKKDELEELVRSKKLTTRTKGEGNNRYIIIDYKTNSERMFHCGSSSKDAGNRVTTITEIECPEIYYDLLDELPKNADLLFK